MIYMANPCGSESVATAMRAGLLGYIDTPAQGNARPAGVTWCADNGAFSDRFDAAAWWRPSINLVDPGKDPARVNTIEVGGNIFDVLGVRPQVGPGFPEKGAMFVQNELIAVISDRLWRTRYGAGGGRAL